MAARQVIVHKTWNLVVRQLHVRNYNLDTPYDGENQVTDQVMRRIRIQVRRSELELSRVRGQLVAQVGRQEQVRLLLENNDRGSDIS